VLLPLRAERREWTPTCRRIASFSEEERVPFGTSMPPTMSGSPPKVSAFDSPLKTLIWPKTWEEKKELLSFHAATDPRFPPAFSKSDEDRLKAMSKEEAEKLRVALLDKAAREKAAAEADRATAKTEWKQRQEERKKEKERKEKLEKKAVEAGLNYYKSNSGGAGTFTFKPRLADRSPDTSPVRTRPPSSDPRPRGYHIVSSPRKDGAGSPTGDE
jgi:hypothetical protein